MKIDRFRYSRELSDQFGIGTPSLSLNDPIDLIRLGRVVLVAGPNGAGKSRLLRLVQQVAQHSLTKREWRTEHQEIVRLQSEIARITSALDGDDALAKAAALTVPGIKAQIEARIRACKKAGAIDWHDDQKTMPLFCMPSTATLVDTNSFTEGVNNQHASDMNILTGGGNDQNARPAAYARKILRAALTARDELQRMGAAKDATAIERDNSFQSLIHDLLGSEFHVTLGYGHELIVNGRSDYVDELSNGEKMLFKLACLLHSQGSDIRNQILMLDEPENHLHPAALIQIVDRIVTLLSDGQLWIATHSVPLIAHLVAQDPNCLWYAHKEKFKNAGREPGLVLSGLFGGAEGVDRLRTLVQLPDKFAITLFIAQCLDPPSVAGVSVEDPQTNQIAGILTAIRESSADKENMRVLDFGAGTGRLLATLSASGGMPISHWLDYFAFDPSPTHSTKCDAEIKLAYGDCKERHFVDRFELESKINAGSMDVVVMCNVLHELPPGVWLEIFGEEGWIARLLAEGGYVLIVEDYGLPIGESAHEYGFLLLDELELAKLFQVNEMDRRQENFVRQACPNQKYANRIFAHLVSKSLVQRANSNSRRKAIESLRDRSLSEMEKAKSQIIGPESARKYALHAVQFSNASLWIKQSC